MQRRVTNWLYARGYGQVGTSRELIGSLMDHAADNLVEALDVFGKRFGAPNRAIVTGASLGGQAGAVTLFKYPDRFSAAVLHCGGLLGWSAYLNPKLDLAFALKTLLDPTSDLPLVHIPQDTAALNTRWKALIEKAQQTPEGRARTALALTLAQGPFWTTARDAEPAAGDVTARQLAAYKSVLTISGEFTGLRRRLEVPAGGATSWNTGVNYRTIFDTAEAVDRDTVNALYRQAGLEVKDDLALLAKAPRVAPEAGPLEVVRKMYPFDGNIQMPVLTMATTGDPNGFAVGDEGYAAAVKRAGKDDLLRRTYVHSAGHCNFTKAERIATYEVLLERLDTGRWPDTSSEAMNRRGVAAKLDEARFWNYKAPVFQRAAQLP